MTESTRPRLQKVTDVQGVSRSSRTRIAVFVALIILLLVLAVCRILMCYSTASSPPESKTFFNTSEEALGCPPDWEKHGGKCYFFSQTHEIKDWNASRKECTDRNSDLVTIDNQDELKYLSVRPEGHYYFLGLTYSASEEKWKWINNMEHSTDMFNIERNYSDYCCAVVGRGKVETASCSGSETVRYMCEKAANILEEQKEN
ncbi:C-type lectin domain family 5 member A-like [Numenius arquata]|uniref:C-type lectin domain family 5 member A-like n=1 Tax=Numenius arquata TaxID=31919 RepID=UPI003D309251